MKIKSTSDSIQIYSILESLKNDFFSDNAKDEQFMRSIAKKFSQYAEFYYVGDITNPYGFIAFYNNNVETKRAFLSMIIVSKQFQGKGVGKTLLFKMIDICKQNGMNSIILEVDKMNDNAIKFYEHYGFEKMNKEKDRSFYYLINI